MAADEEITEQDLADLAALADGSISQKRRACVERRLAGSPRLRSLLAEQRLAVSALREAPEPASEALRTSLRTHRDRHTKRKALVRKVAVAGAISGLLAAVALSVPGGGGLGVTQFADLGSRPPLAAAPPTDQVNPGLLGVNVQGVSYPNWEPQFGLKPVGMRSDSVQGRSATTVFYKNSTQTVAYTIVSGPPVPAPENANSATSGGFAFRGLRLADANAVTWERDGHTCVLTSRDTDQTTLIKLGAWSADRPAGYG